jgi:hypothetical protein
MVIFLSSLQKQIKKLKTKEERKKREIERQIITEAQKEGLSSTQCTSYFTILNLHPGGDLF